MISILLGIAILAVVGGFFLWLIWPRGVLGTSRTAVPINANPPLARRRTTGRSGRA